MLDVGPLEALRRQRPLIHCVSNLVTANDCANLALAVGASPMMACAPQEMAEITAAASATVLNTGTPDEERIEVCRLCGCEAVRLGHPVVLDPVGVGASPWRLRRTQELERQNGILHGVIMLIFGIALQALAPHFVGSPMQDLLSGIILGLSVGILLLGIYLIFQAMQKP